jgi:ELWxxDGT repeat protein
MGTTNLFSLSGEIVINSEYEFVVDGNFLYLLERYGGFSSTPAYRFSLTTQNLTLIPSGNERGDYAITDDGIVFNGFGELDGHASIKPQYLARDQNEPTVYAPAEDYRFGGVYFAAPAGGNTVRISYNADDGFKRERYDPATGTTTGLNSEFPGVTTSSAYFAGVVGDQLIVRENSSDGTSFYAYIDEKPEPLIDAESNQPFRLPRGVLRLYNHIYWVNYGTEFTPEVRAVEGMEVSLIATGQTTTLALSDITLSGGRVTMRFSGRTIGSDTKFFIVDDRSGTVLMDSLLSSLHYRHLVSAESGTWFAHHDTLADAYSLRYIRYDGTPATSIPLTGNLEPAGRLDPMAIGERLLFNLPDETGSRWWSADAAAGTITAMPGARPLGDHSDFDLYAQSTPSAVFYAGVNDERNEVTLWRTDGTPDGTYQVADINPTPSLAFSSNTRYNDSLLVLAAAGPQGVEPYVVDMTAEDRTALLADINPGGGHSYPDDIIVWDEGVYFTAYPDAQGARQLYYVQDFNTSTPRLQTVVRLSLYPNPTTERARVEVTDQHQLREIEVMDNLGRRVLRQAGGGQRAELDVSRLPAGTYHVISHFVDGGRGYGKLSVAR